MSNQLLAEGTEVLFFGQTGKARHGIVVGLAAVGRADGDRDCDPTDDPAAQLVGYAVKTKWEVRPVLFSEVVAPFGDGTDGLDIPAPEAL